MQVTSDKSVYQMHTCIYYDKITIVTIYFNYSGLSKSESNKFNDRLPFEYQEPIKLILITHFQMRMFKVNQPQMWFKTIGH